MTAIQTHAAALASEAVAGADAAPARAGLGLSTHKPLRDVMEVVAAMARQAAANQAVAPEAGNRVPNTGMLAPPPVGGPPAQGLGRSHTTLLASAAVWPALDKAPDALLEARKQQIMARAQVALQRLAQARSGADALTPIAAHEVAPIVSWPPASATHTRVPRSVATRAMGRYSVAAVHEQGRRAEMEDATTVAWFAEDGLGVAAVFDGHGGAETANQAATLIGPVLQGHLRRIPRNLRGDREAVVAAIQNAFASVDEDLRGPRRFWKTARRQMFELLGRPSPLPSLHAILRRRHRAAQAQLAYAQASSLAGSGAAIDPSMLQAARPSGAAALVAVFWRDALYLANLGDSRAVLVRDDGTAWRLSKDQKPEDEVKQIAQRGGIVAYVEGAHRVDRSVAMARALGDYTLAVGRRPQVTPIDLTDAGHCALMLGCDGVFDCIHDDVHAAYIYEKLQAGVSPERIASDLVNASHARFSRDNMSILLIPLKPRA